MHDSCASLLFIFAVFTTCFTTTELRNLSADELLKYDDALDYAAWKLSSRIVNYFLINLNFNVLVKVMACFERAATRIVLLIAFPAGYPSKTEINYVP